MTETDDTEITDDDLGTDYWATTEQVRDRHQIEVGGEKPTYATRIDEATQAIQSDWAEATGKNIPDDLPGDVPKLLQYATADLAASYAHLNFAQNVSGDNDGDDRHVFLERRSEKQFDKWKQQANLSPDSEQGDSGIGTVRGRSTSLSRDIVERDRSPGEGW